MPKIHPTAIVDPRAQLGDDVEIGPFCRVEGDVTIGAGSVLRESVIIRRYTIMGSGNLIDSGTVLGGDPQDLKFDPKTVSYLRIGDNNTFRENVTISRATGEGNETRVGSKTYWMAGSHAGHNATIGDEVIFVNGSVAAGYVTIGRKTIMGGYAGVHQFTWVGEMVMSMGHSTICMHVPPYCMAAGVNSVAGLNRVGLRRSPDITDEDRRQIKQAFRLVYRSGLPRMKALAEMDACTEWRAPAVKFREFVRRVLTATSPFNRGLAGQRRSSASAEAD